MNIFMQLITVPLGILMSACYQLFKHYGFAILLFTLCTKILLMPLSMWVHKNSIKMVKMQPEINFLKANHYGDLDYIADEQAKIFKREKYNPFASIIPLFIQIVLLMGLVGVIYNPLNYLLELPAQLIEALGNITVELTAADPMSSSIQLLVVDAIKNPEFRQSFLALQNQFPDVSIPAILDQIAGIKLVFLGFNLSWVPSSTKGFTFLVPVIAGFSSWLLCMIQNKISVLQSEQGRVNKYGTMALSVGLSLYLGWFVPAGVALYWIASNAFAVIQLFILNHVISPNKYINYEELEKSKDALAAIEALQPAKRLFERDPNAKREKADYKRFFSIANKHLVFYSEKSGFYKYFENVIEYLLDHSNVIIHYITSDPNDAIFEKAKAQTKIKPYYIGEKKLITLMMKMDADMVVMTVPDLDNYHLKRSYVRNDIEYVYMFHYPLSTHMVLKKEALHHYDTIFCVGEFQIPEIRETEHLYHLNEKKLVVTGYGVLEQMYEKYQQLPQELHTEPKVLIAPSWQEDNILDSCLDALLQSLLGQGLQVVVRPHPEYVKRYGARMDAIVQRYSSYSGGNLNFELDFTSSDSIFNSDVVITDWSGTAYEFAFVTKKPAIFIDTPSKINNPDYDKISVQPLEIALRDKIGIRINPDIMGSTAEVVKKLLSESDQYCSDIAKLQEQYIAYFGKSGEIGGKYILSQLKEMGEQKKHAN